jgi:hypothetical protein
MLTRHFRSDEDGANQRSCFAVRQAGWKDAWYIPTVLVLAIGAVFGQAVSFGWVNLDDSLHVTENPLLHPVQVRSLIRIWTAPYENLYIPVAYTAFAGEAIASRAMHGAGPLDARVFHAFGVLLHVANTLLVWQFLRRATPSTVWAPAVGAALFAVHPLQVESVAWISEQRGLLASAFALSSLMLLWERRPTKEPRGGRTFRVAAALALFAAGLLAKPQVVTLPLMLLVLDYCVTHRSWRSALRDSAPFFVVAVLGSLLTASLQPVDGMVQRGLWTSPIVAGDALFFYTRQLLWPFRLCCDYGRTPAVVVESWASWGFALAAWSLVIAACSSPRWAGCRAPVLLGLVALLPVLGFVPFVFQAYSTVADRYCYLAMIGPALAVTWLIRFAGLRYKPLTMGVCVGVILVLLGIGSFLQVRSWQDSRSLNAHALAVNPRSFLGACNMGSALLDAQDPAAAVPFLTSAVAVGPQFVNAHLNLGIALDQIGRMEEAAECYENVLLLNGRHAEAHNFLGVIHARKGRLEVAASHFRAAVESRPDYADARRNLERAKRVLSPPP